jgi:hypothetical protein
MKLNRETSFAATKTMSNQPVVYRLKLPCGVLTTLILLLSVLQLQLFAPAALAETTGKKHGDAQQWSVQVDKIDAGDVALEPSFNAAIYENLLKELAKTKQFKEVYRSGDRNANDVPGLLILKTTVQKYSPGSETKRAVTTVAGATKLNVRIQLSTRDGHLVLEHVVDGNVRWMGGNLKATQNLAHNVAGTLKNSTLPQPTAAPAQQTAAAQSGR